MSVVEMHSVSRHYPGGLAALDRVDLRIEPGELLAIVGPSGSGKSTLLNLAGALDRPTSGTVVIDGHDIGRLRDRDVSALRARRIGFVFQQSHLRAGVPLLENVADGLLYCDVPARERRRLAAQALERVRLSHRLDHRPHQLSGGERQRAAIARALVREPALLLADEPTGSLDSTSGAEVMALLRGLHATGTTVVVITHDAAIAATMPRQVRVLDGRIVSAGTPTQTAREALASPGSPVGPGSPVAVAPGGAR